MDSLTEPVNIPSSTSSVVDALQRQAKGAKLTGYICVGSTLLIGVAILLTFLFFSQISATQRADRERMLVELKYQQQKAVLAKLTDAGTASQLRDTINSLIDYSNNNRGTEINRNSFEDIVYEVSSSVIRIGAVLVGIYLIQIMVNFARYYFKLASHLFMSASLISLSNGKLSDLKTTAPLFMPAKIDFGKEPISPAEKVFEGALSAIRELSRKIPTR